MLIFKIFFISVYDFRSYINFTGYIMVTLCFLIGRVSLRTKHIKISIFFSDGKKSTLRLGGRKRITNGKNPYNMDYMRY